MGLPLLRSSTSVPIEVIYVWAYSIIKASLITQRYAKRSEIWMHLSRVFSS
jgi:hypothetical protein